MNQQYWNLILIDSDDRKNLIEKLSKQDYPKSFEWISGKKSLVISPRSILKFIDKEQKHDDPSIEEEYGQTLASMSSGERKRVFLEYTLSKNPEVLILDHFFDSLDANVKVKLTKLLQAYSKEISILNIFSRKGDELTFLNKQLQYHNHLLSEYSDKSSIKPSSDTSKVRPLPQAISNSEDTQDELIAFRKVSVAYGEKKILNHIDWVVHKGEFWHLQGPNGSGKTTLLSMVVGDNHKAYGQDLYLFGTKKGSGESIWDIKRRIGYFTSNMTFQFWRMQPIRDMIVSGFYDSIGLYKNPGDHQVTIAKQWLRFLDLEKYENKPFIKMSLCQQRMVMIARAMVKHPPLLILDEPSVDLDENSAKLIAQLINRIAQESETAIIYVSHRGEPELVPEKTLELKPTENGSIAFIY